MTTDTTSGRPVITSGHRYLLLAATVMTYLLITLGGVVCVTESAEGCPDWPGCYGRIIPPPQMDAIIEYVHRLIAALTTPFIVAAAVVGWRKARSHRWVSWPPLIAIAFLLAVVVFGAFAVLRGLPRGLAAADLGSALMVLALLVTALVVAFARRDDPTLPDRLSFHTSFAKLCVWTLGVVFVVLVSGVLVADSGSLERCLGWPPYGGRWAPAGGLGWLQMVRSLIAGLATILVVAVVVQAWRTQHKNRAIPRVATAIGVSLLAETLIAALMPSQDGAVALLVTQVATAAALWAMLVALVGLAGLGSALAPEET